LLLLTAYRNLPTPYPTVPSPTLYDVPFSHNTKRYRQTDDRWTEHRTISATVLPSNVYGRLKNVFVVGALPQTPLGELTALPQIS